ncbi:MAG: glutamate racemase [Candidatus Berkiellales bacterium]
MSFLTKQELPIGIFDSGVGGLSVLRTLKKALPYEHFLYLGDTARLPYGTKSAETVRSYALNANEELVSRGVKALVVACNTATAVALEVLQEKFYPLPVIGVIEPGVAASLKVMGSGPIIVLATEGTVKWHAYRKILAQLAKEREIIEWPCSLLVALAEEGWCEGVLVEQIIAKVLEPLFASTIYQSPACIVLGCTHFPVFKEVIQKVVGPIPIIDPAYTVAEWVISTLDEQNLLRKETTVGSTHFMATDGIDRFTKVAKVFLDYSISDQQVELISLFSGIKSEIQIKSA